MAEVTTSAFRPKALDWKPTVSSFDSMRPTASSSLNSKVQSVTLRQIKSSRKKLDAIKDEQKLSSPTQSVLPDIFIFKKSKVSIKKSNQKSKPKEESDPVGEQPLVWLSNGTRPFTARKELLQQVQDEILSRTSNGKTFFGRRKSPTATPLLAQKKASLGQSLSSERDGTAPKNLSNVDIDAISEGAIREKPPLVLARIKTDKNSPEGSRMILPLEDGVSVSTSTVPTPVQSKGSAQLRISANVLNMPSKPQPVPQNRSDDPSVSSSKVSGGSDGKRENKNGIGKGTEKTSRASPRKQTRPSTPINWRSTAIKAGIRLKSPRYQQLQRRVISSIKEAATRQRIPFDSLTQNDKRSPSKKSSLKTSTASSLRSASLVRSELKKHSNASMSVMVSHPGSTKHSTSNFTQRTSHSRAKHAHAGIHVDKANKVIRTTSIPKPPKTSHHNAQSRGYLSEDHHDVSSHPISESDDSIKQSLHSKSSSKDKKSRRPLSPINLASIKEAKEILKSCESYMTWSKGYVKKDKLMSYVDKIKKRFITPPPAGEFIAEEVVRFHEIEFYSCLGALCFFQIELKMFQDACDTIRITQNFVTQALHDGYLRQEYIFSFDYVWNLLRLYGSVVEYKSNKQYTHFNQMDLSAFTSFGALNARVQAGVYGLKAYFFAAIGYRLEKIVEALRAAIFLEGDYYEWHLLLGRALRCSRKNHIKIAIKPVGLEEEMQAVSKATELAPTNPRCCIAGMEAVLDMACEQELKKTWSIFSFGKTKKFYHMPNVAKFLKDRAVLALRQTPKSISVNMALVDIFASVLPTPRRDVHFARECLQRCQKFHAQSTRVHTYVGQFHLLVERSYKEAEVCFDTAFAIDSTNFAALKHLLLLMMRTLVSRQTGILEVTKSQLRNPAWDRRQKASLHFLRGLTFLASSRPAECFEELYAAKKLSTVALTFDELPDYHRAYGWSGWPSRTVLSFGNIRLEAQVYGENEVGDLDVDRKVFVHTLVETLSRAEEEEVRSRVGQPRSQKKEQRDQSNTLLYFYSTKLSSLED